MPDEVTHAKLAFGLAARFGDGPVGPGALDVSQTMPRSEVHDIFDGLVLDGCIGETVSAAAAAIGAASCGWGSVAARAAPMNGSTRLSLRKRRLLTICIACFSSYIDR